jgi:cyanophycinase
VKRHFEILIGLLLMLACASPLLAGKTAPLPYSYFRVGNTSDVTASTTPGTVMMGGGTDVDAAFQWMCEQSGNGDFLVIRATGTDAYNPYIKQLCPKANSVATLIIPTVTAANHPEVTKIILQAEAIWIAGGDQSDYINYWKGTPVQAALNTQIARGVPIGGTSAGLNVLSQFVYSAQASKGVTSSQTLANPFNRYMSFDRDFVTLPILEGLIGDPHFFERDRMGRDLAFMCRIYLTYPKDWSSSSWPRTISVDEQTALLIDETGKGTVVGDGAVYFMQAPGAPEVCKSNTPLTYKNIKVHRISGGDSFDLRLWTGAGGTDYTVSAIGGVMSTTQSDGSLY